MKFNHLKKCIYDESRSTKKQRGLTLIELMVVVAIVAVISAIVMSKADTSGPKAVALYNNMNTIKGAMLRAKMDMGAMPSNSSVLWVKANATAANMFGGLSGQNSWSGPYMGSVPLNAANQIQISSIADTATITMNREGASPTINGGNYTWVYYLRAANVPNPIVYKFLKQCSGSDDTSSTTFVNSPCRASPGTGSTEVGTVDLRVDDSY